LEWVGKNIPHQIPVINREHYAFLDSHIEAIPVPKTLQLSSIASKVLGTVIASIKAINLAALDKCMSHV
jgi:hypothetical protein